eukprot:jgi/Bigna1/70796/fgenesh1_pg.13_\
MPSNQGPCLASMGIIAFAFCIGFALLQYRSESHSPISATLTTQRSSAAVFGSSNIRGMGGLRRCGTGRSIKVLRRNVELPDVFKKASGFFGNKMEEELMKFLRVEELEQSIKVTTSVEMKANARLKNYEEMVVPMTPEERGNPDLLTPGAKGANTRIKRIAEESGKTIQEVQSFIGEFYMMRQVMTRVANGEDMAAVQRDVKKQAMEMAQGKFPTKPKKPCHVFIICTRAHWREPEEAAQKKKTVKKRWWLRKRLVPERIDPAITGAEPLPVFFWIYGGSFLYGGGAGYGWGTLEGSKIYNGYTLAPQDRCLDRCRHCLKTGRNGGSSSSASAQGGHIASHRREIVRTRLPPTLGETCLMPTPKQLAKNKLLLECVLPDACRFCLSLVCNELQACTCPRVDVACREARRGAARCGAARLTRNSFQTFKSCARGVGLTTVVHVQQLRPVLDLGRSTSTQAGRTLFTVGVVALRVREAFAKFFEPSEKFAGPLLACARVRQVRKCRRPLRERLPTQLATHVKLAKCKSFFGNWFKTFRRVSQKVFPDSLPSRLTTVARLFPGGGGECQSEGVQGAVRVTSRPGDVTLFDQVSRKPQHVCFDLVDFRANPSAGADGKVCSWLLVGFETNNQGWDQGQLVRAVCE